MNRNLFLTAVVAAAMATGVNHIYLFGPDEPREAEIARETLKDHHWVVPRLCGLPFLEKPPLYYDLVALAYSLSGRVTPSVARSVSTALGILMIVPAFMFADRWRGQRTAWLTVLILLTMPRFWKYSHVILLDVAVGAFCTWAIVCFARAALREPDEKQSALCLWLCAVSSAAAFLTKGVPALFSIAAVVAGFCIMEKRRDMLKALFSPLPLLSFLIPVGLWVLLLYREGGVPYLHEHFVNNLAGRFLQKHFELADTRFYHTDLGHRSPWHFYVEKLPEILGLWVVILPFAVWRAVRKARNPSAGRDAPSHSLLLLWAFLPAFLFSFSGIKERTYILPSYTGMAILIGAWLDGKLGACPSNGSRRVSSAGRPDARRVDEGDAVRIVEDDATKQTAVRRRNPPGRCRLRRVSALLRPRRITLDTPSALRLDTLASGLRRGRAHYSDRLLEGTWNGTNLLWIVFPFSLFSILGAHIEAARFTVIAVCALSPVAVYGIVMFLKKRLANAVFAAITVMLCVLIISHSPNVLYSRYKRKCPIELAMETRRIVGAEPLYFYRPSDNIRGAVSFYADRTIREIDRPDELKRVLSTPKRVYVIMEEGWYEKFINDPSFFDLLYPIPARSYAEDPDNMLLSNR